MSFTGKRNGTMGRLKPRKTETPDAIRAGIAVIRSALERAGDGPGAGAFRAALIRRERELAEATSRTAG